MFKPSDVPEDLGSRTARMQHFIAGSLIRPTSRHTGEQRLMLKDHTDNSWSDSGRITPTTFAQGIDNVLAQKERIPKLREQVESKTFGRDMLVETLHEDMPSAERERATADIHKLYQPDISRAQSSLDYAENAKMPLTGAHTALAALLGKRAVGWALSDENPKNGWVNKDSAREPSYTFDDGVPGIDVLKHAQSGEGKAAHHAETASLPLMQRVAARVAPWHANVHALNSAYGGPEEGGWTYTTGKTITHSRGYVTQRGARKAAEKLSKQFTPGTTDIRNMSPSDAYQMDKDQGAFDPVIYTDNTADAMGMPSTFVQEPNDKDYDYSHFGKPSEDYDVTVTRGKTGDFPKNKPYYE